jgi:hypothetical protein
MRPANRAAPRRIPSQSWRLDPVSGLSEGNSALHAFPGIPDVLRMHAIVPLGPRPWQGQFRYGVVRMPQGSAMSPERERRERAGVPRPLTSR